MDKEQIKAFLRENLEVVVEYKFKYLDGENDQVVGLRFKGEKKCFTKGIVFIEDK